MKATLGTAVLGPVLLCAVTACGVGRAPGAALQGGGRPLASPEAERTDPSVQKFLDATLPRGSGGTVVAARGGRLVHCKGFGLADHEKRIPARCDTAYDVMSMTKQFTAAAVMKLEAMGRLRVTDPIGRFLGPVPAGKRGITVHHLLTHTAGLDDDDIGIDDYDPVSRDGMVATVLGSRLQSAPGAEFHYSNQGYSLLAAIIEKVSGTGYERFLSRYLFTPSGMTRTGYVLPRWDRDQIAVEYDENGERQGRPFEHPWAADGPYWGLRGNGGIISTPRDMFRWHRALRSGAILPAGAKRRMFRPHVHIGEHNGFDLSYGYGWAVTRSGGGRLVRHDGGNDWSYGEFARYLDDRVMVFWITNRAYKKGGWNFEDLNPALTGGIMTRVREAG
ncbi:beta-lactamase family protein [Actinomadura graeca]|uniref:Beta-lactamase family protein n=1 Tax=Actinomadura graeca TaxID=2750812 RepID=A0ABX8R023_9ACTN|nr:serine hydrolase domain-containing protein [Actinomadura graeca]QXJ22388.1 beta-lactamase family protein [Actinomadura graeca]